MKGKKSGFQSLEDAKGLLKDLGKRLAANSNPDRSGAAPSPRPERRSNPFESIERQLRDRARHQQPIKKPSPRGPDKKAPAKQNKVVLSAPGLKRAYQEYLAQQRKLSESAATATSVKPPVDPRKNWKDGFEEICRLVAKSSPRIESRPDAVSPKTRTEVENAITKGAQAYGAAPLPDLDDGFIVGFDLGTSSLKVAVRQPYKADNPFAVMPVPVELRSGSHPYLWQTALWFSEADQSFSLLPRPDLQALEGFKTGIIGGNGGLRVSADLPVTRSEAAVAFIALQIAHFLGWYQVNRPLRAGGERPLAINVGIPVAAQDDHRTFRDFKRIVAAAQVLVSKAAKLTLSLVRQTYHSAADELPDGWYLIPELTAAISGYARSPNSQSGSHMLVDVGASTLDIVAFNLLRGERIAVISAAVELLGSASLDLARANGISDKEFMGACNYQFHEVFTRQACRPERGANGFSPTRRRRDVQLVTTGGGCANPVHAEFIATMTKPGVLGPLPILHPEAPAKAGYENCDLSRLLLAYGLTGDVPDLLELRLPSQVPNIPPAGPGPDLYVSKDVT